TQIIMSISNKDRETKKHTPWFSVDICNIVSSYRYFSHVWNSNICATYYNWLVSMIGWHFEQGDDIFVVPIQ
ncbi:MAG: hypothetical protein ACJ71M_17905, partial [Nitrososphaeraceae archaeon]